MSIINLFSEELFKENKDLANKYKLEEFKEKVLTIYNNILTKNIIDELNKGEIYVKISKSVGSKSETKESKIIETNDLLCQGKTSKNDNCKNKVKDGEKYCYCHKKIYLK